MSDRNRIGSGLICAAPQPGLLCRREKLHVIGRHSSMSLVSQGDVSMMQGGFYANSSFRETQSDCEILDDNGKAGKLQKKRRGSKLSSTLSNSLRRLGSIRKSKEPKQMTHLPALVSGLGNIAFGIGAGYKCAPDFSPDMRMRSKSNDFDLNSNAYRRKVLDSNLDSAGGELSASVDMLMDMTSYLDITHDSDSAQSNGRPKTLTLEQSDSEGESLSCNRLLSTNTSVELSTSEDSLDELDQPTELTNVHHRPVRRLHKSYKIAVKNRPINATSPMKEEAKSVMTDEASDEDLDLSAPSPFKRNMYKSYRVAMAKLKDHDGNFQRNGINSSRNGACPSRQAKSFAGRTAWMANGKPLTRQAQMSYKAAMSNKRTPPPPVEIVSPPAEFRSVPATPNIIPPTPNRCSSGSSSAPLRSSMNGDFVSIFDIKRMTSTTSVRRSSFPEESDEADSTADKPKRTNSSPDIDRAPFFEESTPLTPRQTKGDSMVLRLPSTDVLSESPNSSIAGSQDDFYSLHPNGMSDSDTDNASELSNISNSSGGGVGDSPFQSQAERDEMRDSVFPMSDSLSKPRMLRQRRRGKDSRRILRDKRVDILLSEQEEELLSLQRSKSLTGHSKEVDSRDTHKLHSKSMKGVSGCLSL